MAVLGDAQSEVWCRQCPGHAAMLRVDEAATLFGTTSLAIYRWVETGGVHFVETARGHLLVCAVSLSLVIG